MDADASTCGMEKPNKDVGASTLPMKEPNKDVGASTLPMKEPNKDVGASTLAMEEPKKDAGASTFGIEKVAGAFVSGMEKPKRDTNDSTYGNEKPKVDAGASTHSIREPNVDANASTYDMEKLNRTAYDSTYGNQEPNRDAYDSTYGNEDPHMDAYDYTYGNEEANMDAYDSTYGMEEPYGDAYDSTYGNEHYMDAYDSTYGNEGPNADAYDSTYGNEEPYGDAYDSTYGNEEPYGDAYDSTYGMEDPKMDMDADASGTGEPRKGRCLQCSMCCYFAPTKHHLVQHYKSALHKYISGLDRKRRSLLKNLQTLDDAIRACGDSEPLIGLEYMYQYAPSKKGIVLYGCKLCQSVFRYDNAYLHIVSPKHKIMYLSKHYPEMEIDIDFTLNVPGDYDQLHNCAQSVEHNFGRKCIKYLDFYYSQKIPIGEMDGPPVTNKSSQRYNVQKYPQSTPGDSANVTGTSVYSGEEWPSLGNDADNLNNKSMDHGGDLSSQSYGEGGPALPDNNEGDASFQYGDEVGHGGPGNTANRFSRRNRFPFPTEEPVPEANFSNTAWGNSDFPGNRNPHSAAPKGGIQLNYQNRQGLQGGRGNANNQLRRPNQDNQSGLRNQSNDFAGDRRTAECYDNRQGPGRQDRFGNADNRQRNNDRFPRNERRDQNEAPREGRPQQGDRRARSPNDRRRNNDRLPQRDQNVAPRDRLNRQGDNGKRDYEQDGYGNNDDRRRNNDRFSRNRREDRNASSNDRPYRQGDRDNSKQMRRNQEGDLRGNQGPYNETDRQGSEAREEPTEDDPDRRFVFSTFGNSATFRELKAAFKAGLIGKKNGQDEQTMDEDSDMDARSMDLSEDEEGSFLFNQELFEFLNNYRVRSDKDERFVIKARELLSSGLRRFDLQEQEARMEEGSLQCLGSTEDAFEAIGYNQGLSSIPMEEYFSYNDRDDRDERDYQDGDDEEDDDDDDDGWAQPVPSPDYFSRSTVELFSPPDREDRWAHNRFSS